MSDTTLPRASSFWDCEAVSPTHNSWMAHPEIRSYINESISGSPHKWPIDWFVDWLAGRRFKRALSVGCGTGPLERDLTQRDLCEFVDAFDGSSESLRIARDMAREAGVDQRINYYVADFNEPRLPSRTYDIVFFHQSAHHVSKLEKLYSAVLRSLKRNGLVYLDEYIGPSRFDWNDDLIAQHRQFYARISPEARLQNPLSLPIHPIDPSEAIRSSEIISQLTHGFRILEQRNYGGSLLSVLFSAVDWTKETSIDVADMIAVEKELLREGMPSYHAIIVARPKRGVFRWYALLRYFVAPKLRRVRWEVSKRVWRNREIKF